ncbi:GNAT family N-acetyltransferase [Thalassotalea agarivorans]|uniref:Acetyltransferase (GNAT) family protein n=1 Tax=Thalassotalea agarivorans TaxID=349064 RepID=A0A1I0BR97_THASX|nr:GNAT family N-acetyltransferase [Thalassotalea agarivorans]SET09167.1 Acetyltransferase (GNAT) family protein [Thalassotalea agarivorans]
MSINILLVNYDDKQQAADLITMMQHYASDPMGGGEAIAQETIEKLIPALQQQNNVVSFLAYQTDKPVGLANCVFGFSTFAAAPLLNIHDLVVVEDVRGLGVGSALMKAAEAHALDANCCKMTLEVLAGNERAKRVYEKAGYKPYELDASMGQAIFWQKSLKKRT